MAEKRTHKAHPWHGISAGENAPEVVNVFIELVPTDTVKYELDKETGMLKIDRPQRYSNVSPTPYGMIPQTYCGEQVAAFAREKTGRDDIVGDGDPLDICVITEKPISHGNIMVQATPIGGLRMIDHGEEADDKIIAVLYNDYVHGGWEDISDMPDATLDRLSHYFLTYKKNPQEDRDSDVEIPNIYGKDEAHEVIRRAQKDYDDTFVK